MVTRSASWGKRLWRPDCEVAVEHRDCVAESAVSCARPEVQAEHGHLRWMVAVRLAIEKVGAGDIVGGAAKREELDCRPILDTSAFTSARASLLKRSQRACKTRLFKRYLYAIDVDSAILFDMRCGVCRTVS